MALSANVGAQEVYSFVRGTYIFNGKEVNNLPKNNETLEGTMIVGKDGIRRTMKKCYTEPTECTTKVDHIDSTGRILKEGSSLLTEEGAKIRLFKGSDGKMIMTYEYESDKNKLEGYEHWVLTSR
ncbi:hypothetical protein [Nitrosomonas communis]|uniref:hypothetical protein n=1 Tax=Nitrosomonas communis TaxID=44574 RepID=UPI0026F34224|nr:hypothetical protein [Nitrosomonas communis]MCO6427542.1 hypothetical protein [Nitrosomonas communis]